MILRRIIPLLICAAALTACSDSRGKSDGSSAAETTAEMTSSEPAETKPAVTIAAESPKNDDDVHFTVGVEGGKVTVFSGESAVSVLELDAPLPNGADDAVTEDFDFDGCDDLCVMTDSALAGGGDKYVYYRYDSDNNSFVPWQELNDIGAEIFVNSHEKLLSYYDKQTPDEDHNSYTYKWDNGRLRLIGRAFYHGDGSKCDLYEYDEDGNEHFVRSSPYIRDKYVGTEY